MIVLGSAFLLVAIVVALLAFVILSARETEPPDTVTGLGLALAAVLCGLLWFVALPLYGLAVGGRLAALAVWKSRNPEPLTEPERQTP